MMACPCREVRSKLYHIEQSYKNAAIPPKYQWKFIENFDMNWMGENDANVQLFTVLDWAHHFIDNYQNEDVEKKGLFLFGPPGVGKTLICCIILNELMRRYDANVRYAKINKDFFGAIQATFSKMDETYGQGAKILRRLQNSEVLVLDDMGIHKESQWADSVLYDLIDSRYENNLLTLFTSNKKPDDFKDLAGGRIFSRLQEMTRFIILDIADYRSRSRVGG
jgi:DNA replication protein DnaC